MSTPLNENLLRFLDAQAALFDQLGITRKNEDGRWPALDAGTVNYLHGSGNLDIPTPYPELLDYRTRPWRMAARGGRGPGDDEVLVLGGEQPTEAGAKRNFTTPVRFNILAEWAHDAHTIVCVATHLPRPDELHYAQPERVEDVANGGEAWGDVCVLLLTLPDQPAPPVSD